jgi:spore coat protein U-like protein
MKIKEIIFLTILFAASASAEISGQIYQISTPAPVAENYIFNSELVISRSFLITTDLKPAPSYTVGVTAGQSGNPVDRKLYNAGGAVISYRIVDSSTSLNDLKDITDNPTKKQILTGKTNANKPVTAAFDIIISAAEFPASGVYFDTVFLRAYDENDNLIMTATLNISINVSTFISLSLVPSGGTYDAASKSYLLDFGFFKEGDLGFLDMIVLSNAFYSIDFTSANNGNFANTDPSDSSRVAYTLRLNSSVIDLSGGSAAVNIGTGPTTSAGIRHLIEIEIRNTEEASSGEYQDIIMLTITAQ